MLWLLQTHHPGLTDSVDHIDTTSKHRWKYRLFVILLSFGFTLPVTGLTKSAISANTPTKTTVTHNDSSLSDQKATTVVIAIQLKPGVQRTQFLKATQPIIQQIKKQPGLLHSDFFENINPALKPGFVHVMRWKSFKEWENMIVNGVLDKLLEPIKPLCTIEPSAYTRVF